MRFKNNQDKIQKIENLKKNRISNMTVLTTKQKQDFAYMRKNGYISVCSVDKDEPAQPLVRQSASKKRLLELRASSRMKAVAK